MSPPSSLSFPVLSPVWFIGSAASVIFLLQSIRKVGVAVLVSVVCSGPLPAPCDGEVDGSETDLKSNLVSALLLLPILSEPTVAL